VATLATLAACLSRAGHRLPPHTLLRIVRLGSRRGDTRLQYLLGSGSRARVITYSAARFATRTISRHRLISHKESAGSAAVSSICV
jgi:hypothetical protein